MHKFSMPEEIIARVVARVGRTHPFDKLEASRTAFVVIDMQNYYLKPGYLGDVPPARDIVPAINKFAADLRNRGAHVIWVKNASNDTRENWSVYHEWLMSPEFYERRYATLDVEHEGHQLWAELDVKLEDTQIVKTRFSAFIQGSSDIALCLRSRGIDTVLIGGAATNVCCDVSARDAMMLNFKVIMVPDVLATYTDAEHKARLPTFIRSSVTCRHATKCWLRCPAVKKPARRESAVEGCSMTAFGSTKRTCSLKLRMSVVGVEQTWLAIAATSEFDPQRTFHLAQTPNPANRSMSQYAAMMHIAKSQPTSRDVRRSPEILSIGRTTKR